MSCTCLMSNPPPRVSCTSWLFCSCTRWLFANVLYLLDCACDVWQHTCIFLIRSSCSRLFTKVLHLFDDRVLAFSSLVHSLVSFVLSVKGCQLQSRCKHVVDNFVMKPEHVLCFWYINVKIKSMYSCRVCTTVLILLLTILPYPSVISRGGMGGCLWTRKNSTFGFV